MTPIAEEWLLANDFFELHSQGVPISPRYRRLLGFSTANPLRLIVGNEDLCLEMERVIELGRQSKGMWHLWVSKTYSTAQPAHQIIHVRCVKWIEEVTLFIEALTGRRLSDRKLLFSEDTQCG